MRHVSLLVAGCVTAAAAAEQDRVRQPHVLVLLDSPSAVASRAVCLDGSPGAYYIRPGHGAGASKWFIHFMGGAWCTSLDNCLDRASTGLGTSFGADQHADLQSSYFSQDPVENPLMHNWNSVVVKYCDGGSFSGLRDAPVEHKGASLHFRGGAIMAAVQEDLLLRQGLDGAMEVVVSGCSAGGLATYLHVDQWEEALQRRCPRLTRFAGLPDSGFFLDYEGPFGFGSGLRWVFEAMNASATLNRRCVAAHEATGDSWRCMFAQYVAPYVRAPLFPLQSAYDWWQIDNIVGSNETASANTFGRELTLLMRQGILERKDAVDNGLYLDACGYHCGNWDGNSLVAGRTGAAAFKEWYERWPAGNASVLLQEDAFPCRHCCKAEIHKGWPTATPTPEPVPDAADELVPAQLGSLLLLTGLGVWASTHW